MGSNSTRYPRDITMGPAKAIAPTASDTVDLPHGVRALIVSVSGDLRVTLIDMVDGDSVTYPAAAVPAGRFVAQVKRLWSTGTTATVALAEF